MNSRLISRRALLLSSAALGCGRRRASGFPGYCLVANRGSRSIAAIDLTQFRVRKQIPLDAAPSEVIAHPDTGRPRALALAPDTGVVYEIDAAGLKTLRSARAGGQALAMQLSPSRDALWVLYRDPAALVQFRLDSFRPGRRIPLPAPPDSFDLSDSRAAIASRQGGVITMVSLASGAVERTLSLQEPSILLFRSDGKQLMAGSTSDRMLTIFEAASGKTVVRLPLPLAPRRFCVSPDNGQVFISGDGVDGVVIAFPYTTEVGETILAGHTPGAMTVTDTTPSYLLAANPGSHSVTAIDVDMRRLVAVVQVGEQPGRIIVTPDKQYALVLNEKSGDVAVIRMFTFTEAWVRRYKSASLFTMIPVGEQPVGAAVVRVG